VYKIVDYSDYDAGVKDVVADTLADLEDVPCSMGSTALVLEDMKYYVLDGQDNWRELA
jgi:hypothetical protein